MSEEWIEVSLGEVCEINPEATPKWSSERTIQYVDIASVSATEGIVLDLVGTHRFGDAPGRARRLIRSGDVLVSTVRPNLRAFAQVPPALDGEVASTGFAVLRGGDRALPGFLWSVVQSHRFVDEMVQRCTGSNYPAIRAADIATFRVNLPPVSVQRRIVDLLAHLDDQLLSLRAELARVRDLEGATLSQLVGATTDGEPEVMLVDVASVFDCEHKTAPAASSTDVVYGYSIGTKDIKDGRLLVGQAKPVTRETWDAWSRRVSVRAGDILMSREAPVGSVALVESDMSPLCLGQRTVLVRAHDGVDPWLLSGLLRSSACQRWMADQSAGLTVAHLNVADIKRLPLKIADLTTDSSARSQVVSALLAHRQQLDAELARLGALRGACLETLVSGGHSLPVPYDDFLGTVA